MSFLLNLLFPEDSLRRSITIVSAKGIFGTVTPLVAMPTTFDSWMHVVQAFAVLSVPVATTISIGLGISRDRRRSIDAANRLDRNREQAMDYFRFRRERKSKHQRRLAE